MKKTFIFLFIFLSFFLCEINDVDAKETTVYDIECFYKPTNRKCMDDEIFGAACKSAKYLHIVRDDEGTGAQSDYSLNFYHFKEYEKTGNDQAVAKDAREWPIHPGPYEEEDNYFGFGSGSNAKCPNTVYITEPDWWKCGYVDLDTGIPCSPTSYSYYYVNKDRKGSNYYIEYTLEYANYGSHTEDQNSRGDALPIDCGDYKYCYSDLELCIKLNKSFKVILPGGTNPVEVGLSQIKGDGREWNGSSAVQPYNNALNVFLNDTKKCPPFILTEQYESDSARWLYTYDLKSALDSLESNQKSETHVCTNSASLDEEIKGHCTVVDLPDVGEGDPMTCASLKATNTYKITKEVFKWIQIVAPIMLIIFGVMDFIKPLLASDTDAMKKAQGAFVKRLIIVAAIILLPFILDFFLSLLDGAMGNDLGTCDLGK